MKLYGYAGKILRVDLSRGKVIEEGLKPDLLKLYLGGTGYAARVLWMRILRSRLPVWRGLA